MKETVYSLAINLLSCMDAIIDVSVHFHHRGEYRFVWAKKLSNGQLVTQDNPATAALKLWLELSDPSDPSDPSVRSVKSQEVNHD